MLDLLKCQERKLEIVKCNNSYNQGRIENCKPDERARRDDPAFCSPFENGQMNA